MEFLPIAGGWKRAGSFVLAGSVLAETGGVEFVDFAAGEEAGSFARDEGAVSR